jgi:hypothetical protein
LGCETNPASLPGSIFVYDQPFGGYINPTYVLTNSANGQESYSYPSNIMIATYSPLTGSYSAVNPSVDNYTGWFYAQQNCVVGYPSFSSSAGALLETTPPTYLTSGWNFLTVMPWMLNQSYSGIFSSCNVNEVYGFNTNANSWQGGQKNMSAYMGTYTATSGEIGESVIVKVSGSCNLQTPTLGSLPPKIAG